MILNHSKKSIFYTFIISTITTLLVSCGGSSSSTPAAVVETAAIAPISGSLKQADGTALDGATVELIPGTATAITGANGIYTITPTATGDFQLRFSLPETDTRGKFVTQLVPITITSGAGVTVPPTVLTKVGVSKEIDNAAGGSIVANNAAGGNITTASTEVTFPSNAAGVNITADLTLLSGTAIPSTLPTQSGKTLLPVGAIALGISPAGSTLTTAAVASVPIPVALQDNTDFAVYALSTDGKWEAQSNLGGAVNAGKTAYTFNITTAGTYMVMSSIDDVTVGTGTADDTVDEAVTTVAPGATLTNSVTNTATPDIPTNITGAARTEVDALIKSLLEQQNQTQFGTTQEETVVVPSVATAKDLAAKLVCTSKVRVRTRTFVFVFNFRGFGIIRIPVRIVTRRRIVTCTDVPVTGAG